jgi:PTH1 family peptidyl-tRNA hydrolase
VKAVIGLGNPGKKYERTRHNVGRMAVRSFLQRSSIPGSVEHDFSRVYRSRDGVLVVEPLVYMNLSGISVKELCERYSVAPEHCLIVYDDYAIPFGQIRIRKWGSAGGHHGMQSVIEELQTEEIPRLRVGIGTERAVPELTEYVLGEFSPEEQAELPKILARAAQAIERFVQTDIETTMNRFNTAR